MGRKKDSFIDRPFIVCYCRSLNTGCNQASNLCVFILFLRQERSLQSWRYFCCCCCVETVLSLPHSFFFFTPPSLHRLNQHTGPPRCCFAMESPQICSGEPAHASQDRELSPPMTELAAAGWAGIWIWTARMARVKELQTRISLKKKKKKKPNSLTHLRFKGKQGY